MKKSPNEVDRQVGVRVRARRLLLNMSQEKLGEALGLTFQQVQKYEKGTNRISASRLQQIAGVLGVSISFLYGGESEEAVRPGFAEAPDGYAVDLITADGLRMLKAFNDIRDPKIRRRLIDLAQTLSGSDDEPAGFPDLEEPARERTKSDTETDIPSDQFGKKNASA